MLCFHTFLYFCLQPTPAAEAREDPDYIVIENDGAQGEEEEEDFTKDVDYADGAIVKESERPVMILREVCFCAVTLTGATKTIQL